MQKFFNSFFYDVQFEKFQKKISGALSLMLKIFFENLMKDKPTKHVLKLWRFKRNKDFKLFIDVYKMEFL